MRIITETHGAPVRIDVNGLRGAVCVGMPAGTDAAVMQAVGELVGGLFPCAIVNVAAEVSP